MPWIWQPEHVKCRHCSRECYRQDARKQSARRRQEQRDREKAAREPETIPFSDLQPC